MSIDKEKEENLDYMSDFLLRIAMISGNADLDTQHGYLVSVRNDSGEYISYHTTDFQIQNALHNSSRNIFHRALSTQRLEADEYYDMHIRIGMQEYNDNSVNLLSNDNYPWEAITALPRDLLGRTQMSRDDSMRITPDKSKEELAKKLSNGAYKVSSNSQQVDTQEEKKIQKLKSLISSIVALSENVSVDIIDGKYYITTPAKDGTFMIYSTTDWKLEEEDRHVFGVRKSSKELDIERLRSDLHGQSSILDGAETELIQHDATLYEIQWNLSKDLGIAEHTAEEIGDGIRDLSQGEVEQALNAITDIENPKKDPHTLE